MDKRVVLLIVIVAASLGNAHATERFSLKYPGWTLYLELQERPPALHEMQSTRSLAIRVPGKSLLSESGLRLPLNDSTFLSLEATVIEWQASPALPATVRRAFQAGVGVGMEF